MIVYLDSSALVRSYLADEPGHSEVNSLLEDDDVAAVTAAITRLEVSGALVRAASTGRGDRDDLLTLLDSDLGDGGAVTVVRVEERELEQRALELVREHGIRALDAWHLAVADLRVPAFAAPGETIAFCSRDEAQAKVAEGLGFALL